MNKEKLFHLQMNYILQNLALLYKKNNLLSNVLFDLKAQIQLK